MTPEEKVVALRKSLEGDGLLHVENLRIGRPHLSAGCMMCSRLWPDPKTALLFEVFHVPSCDLWTYEVCRNRAECQKRYEVKKKEHSDALAAQEADAAAQCVV
jgi:hypothetical protein